MSLESALLMGRAAAEARMTDTCRITKPGDGESVWNPASGNYDPPPRVVVYEGPCRRKQPDVGGVTTSGAGPESWDISSSILCLPVLESVDVGGSDQIVEYLTAQFDPDLEGRTFGVVGGAQGSQQTQRRIHMKAAT